MQAISSTQLKDALDKVACTFKLGRAELLSKVVLICAASGAELSEEKLSHEAVEFQSALFKVADTLGIKRTEFASALLTFQEEVTRADSQVDAPLKISPDALAPTPDKLHSERTPDLLALRGENPAPPMPEPLKISSAKLDAALATVADGFGFKRDELERELLSLKGEILRAEQEPPKLDDNLLTATDTRASDSEQADDLLTLKDDLQATDSAEPLKVSPDKLVSTADKLDSEQTPNLLTLKDDLQATDSAEPLKVSPDKLASTADKLDSEQTPDLLTLKDDLQATDSAEPLKISDELAADKELDEAIGICAAFFGLEPFALNRHLKSAGRHTHG